MAVGKMLVEAAALVDDERESVRKRLVRDVVCIAAELLSNTPAVCKSYCIHPGLSESFLDGTFSGHFAKFRPRAFGKL